MTYYLEEVSPLMINKTHFGTPLPGIFFVQYGCLQLDVQCWEKEVTLEILAKNSSFGFYHNCVSNEDTRSGLPLLIPFKPKLLFNSRVLILRYHIIRKLRLKYSELDQEFGLKERHVLAFGMPFCDFFQHKETYRGNNRLFKL